MHVATESGLVVHDLMNGNSSHIDEYLNIYRTLFPQYSRYVPVMRRRAELPLDRSVNERWHQWLIMVKGNPAGIIGFLYNRNRNVGLLMDFAIYQEFRSVQVHADMRFSHFILNLAMQQLVEDARENALEAPFCMAAEVEYPSLVKKYTEYGYVEFPVEYFEPPYTPELADLTGEAQNLDKLIGYERMHVGAFPIPGHLLNLSDPAIIKTTLLAFLQDHYHLPFDHWLIEKVIHEMPA